MFVWIFSANFIWNIIILRSIQRDIIINVYWSSCKVQRCPTRKETSYSDRRFWFLYILFIIIIGWILVLYIYIHVYTTRLASNEIFSPSNKIHRELGRAKDLSAPLYTLFLSNFKEIWIFSTHSREKITYSNFSVSPCILIHWISHTN